MLKDTVKINNEYHIKVDETNGDRGFLFPSLNTIQDAFIFVSRLPQIHVEPYVSVADDGELVIEWKHNSKKVVVSFEGDHQFAYALYKDGEFVPGAEEGSLANEPLPHDLVAYLETM